MFFPDRLFIAEIAGPDGALDALGDWCKAAVAPLRGTPGVERIGRYRKLNDVRTLVVADVTDERALPVLHAAFASPAPYTAATFTARQTAERRRPDAPPEPRDLPLLYTVGFPAPPDRMTDIGEWYDVEHVPMLQRCPTWVTTRRFAVDGSAPRSWGTHLAVHYLSDIGALRSKEREEARRTPWRDTLAAHPWFRGAYTLFLQEE